jgi:acetyltransferase-like isoleucine patch superfamily enzyme
LFKDASLIESAPGQALLMGARTTLQSRCQIRGEVTIGDDVLFAQHVFVSSGTHQVAYAPELRIRAQDRRYREDHGVAFSDPISIGDDCWLGNGAVVTPGTTLGDGCVVGANAVVIEDVAPYTIVGGVPARFLKDRPHDP